MLASLLFPYDDDAPKLVPKWLDELAKENCVTLYEVDGDKYVEVANWLKHQKIDKPTASKLPGPREASRIFSKPRECSSEDLDLGPRTSIKDQDHSVATQRADEPPPPGPLDLKKELWSRGVAFLKTHSIAERDARHIIGRWRKSHGDLEVLNALAAAEGGAVSDPVPYVAAVLSGKEKLNGRGNSGQHGQSLASEVFGELYATGRARREISGGGVR
jgi:hypothetical protein